LLWGVWLPRGSTSSGFFVRPTRRHFGERGWARSGTCVPVSGVGIDVVAERRQASALAVDRGGYKGRNPRDNEGAAHPQDLTGQRVQRTQANNSRCSPFRSWSSCAMSCITGTIRRSGRTPRTPCGRSRSTWTTSPSARCAPRPIAPQNLAENSTRRMRVKIIAPSPNP